MFVCVTYLEYYFLGIKLWQSCPSLTDLWKLPPDRLVSHEDVLVDYALGLHQKLHQRLLL